MTKMKTFLIVTTKKKEKFMPTFSFHSHLLPDAQKTQTVRIREKMLKTLGIKIKQGGAYPNGN
jgi:hypothetical protein